MMPKEKERIDTTIPSPPSPPSPSLLQFLAVGESTSALVASFLLFGLSVLTAVYINKDDNTFHVDAVAYRKLGPPPKIDPPIIFQFQKNGEHLVSSEMQRAFEKDGVIAVRGLLDDEILNQLDEASLEMIHEQHQKDKLKPRGALSGGPKRPNKKQFFTTQHGTIFRKNITTQESNTNIEDSNNIQLQQQLPPFLRLASLSNIPSMAAELLELSNNKGTNNKETLRVMRDIFLAISEDEQKFLCGWHVDDTGFWPATSDAPGVNAWIALDDMPIERGGGFALAVGSHTAPWREAAYNVTGSTHTFPEEGFSSAADMLKNRIGNGTCNIKTSANHLHRRMEDVKRVYDIKKGDVIFHHRFLFHRSIPFKRDAIEKRISRNDELLLYRRYSIRYGPGHSKIPKGWGTEMSVLWDSKNAGRTADQVAEKDGPWYPMVWPHVSEEEFKQLQTIVNRMPIVSKQFEARRKQLKHKSRASSYG